MAAGEETKGMLSGITCACKQGEQLQLIHGSGVPMSVSNYAPTQTRPGTWSEQRAGFSTKLLRVPEVARALQTKRFSAILQHRCVQKHSDQCYWNKADCKLKWGISRSQETSSESCSELLAKNQEKAQVPARKVGNCRAVARSDMGRACIALLAPSPTPHFPCLEGGWTSAEI